MNEKLNNILQDSFNRHLKNGGCIKSWFVHLDNLEIIVKYNFVYIMKIANGLEKPKFIIKKLDNYLLIKSWFGQAIIPNKVVETILALDFIP